VGSDADAPRQNQADGALGNIDEKDGLMAEPDEFRLESTPEDDRDREYALDETTPLMA
jgi:CTD nuclear envelope phosphatase 1